LTILELPIADCKEPQRWCIRKSHRQSGGRGAGANAGSAKTIETLITAVHNARPLPLLFTFIFLLSSAAGSATAAPPVTGQQHSQLQAQLEAAEKAADKPAIIELSRRILALNPNDSDAWETLAQTQLETEDLDRLEQTLDAWQKAVRRPPAAIEDLRGGVCFKRKDYQNAERHWLAYLATKPPPDDAATEYDNLANLCAEQARWEDHAAYRTKAIAARDSASRRVARACAFLRLRKWHAAYADMAKANKMDASDSEVKEWLPQFERLQKFLPQIKALDAQIAKSPNDIGLLLERARLFTLAGRPLLALDDAQRALNLQPASMRARIQTAEALLDTGRPEDAAKLQVNDKLARAEDKHVSEQALRELDRLDTRLLANPKDPDALAERSKILTELRQFTLALADANAALAITNKSAAAQFGVAQALDGLGRQKEALAHARIATELDPKDPAKWFLRGVLERQGADFAAAIESQTRSLEITESVVALSEREQCERRMGKVSQADADLRRIRELAPEKAP
jgi:tetratricopeptide (TPR) repeat protein